MTSSALTTAELVSMRATIDAALPDLANILNVTYTPDGQGGYTDSWGTALVSVPCRLAYERGLETIAGGGLQPFAGLVLTMPYNTALTTANRVEQGGVLYDVKSVDAGKSNNLCVRAQVGKIGIVSVSVPIPATPIVAYDSGLHVLNGIHTGVTLGGSVNRAYYVGVDAYGSNTDIYSTALDALFDGKEWTVIIRGAIRHASTWSDGVNHNLISIYTYPFGNDATIDISAGGLLEWTMMTGGFPGIITRQISASDLGWMTLGMTISQSASEMRAYKEGVQQGAAVGAGMDWSRPLWVNGCYIGAPTWKGWAADCIISFGVVATPTQMLTIHTALDAGTLTTTALDAIFGAGKYAWWKLDES